jgi:hypothetical protein
MQYVLVGLGVLMAVLLGLKVFVRANPALLAQKLRLFGGLILVAFSVLLLMRGQAHVALLLLAVGIPVLIAGTGGRLSGRNKAPGQTSQVKTALVLAQLDHDTGAMTGTILHGPFAGRALDSLGIAELQSLLTGCRDTDTESAALLEAYLDQAHPKWRETRTAAGGGAPSGETGPLTPAEARKILGVGPEATAETIRAAWREAMKRNHPDQGGSGYIAAKINEAKDVLLGKGT